MSRALSSAALLAAVSDGLAVAITRRSYSAAAAATQGFVRGRNSGSDVLLRGGEEKVMKKEEGVGSSSSWFPDPVTGNYKPVNRVEEVDVAELRNVLLNQKH